MNNFQSAHGLGNIRGIDEKQWWMNILNMHYLPDQKEDILSKYPARKILIFIGTLIGMAALALNGKVRVKYKTTSRSSCHP